MPLFIWVFLLYLAMFQSVAYKHYPYHIETLLGIREYLNKV